MAGPHTLLLTGVPGIGKTTVIRRAADLLADRRLGGFYTEEMRDQGDREGFRLVSFDGTERIIAHVKFSKRHRVGKYGVDVLTLDNIAVALLRKDQPVEVFLIDEIGKMECLSLHFVAAMRDLLSSDKLVIASIARKGTGLMAEAKERADAETWEVTRENRDQLPLRILNWITHHQRRDRPDSSAGA